MVKSLIITPENSELITRGGVAFVYVVGDKAIKVPRRVYSDTWDDLLKECDIQDHLYRMGYPVPEPYGISPIKASPSEDYARHNRVKEIIDKKFYLETNSEKMIERDGFFMARIYGEMIEDLPNMESLLDEAREIVKDIGLREGILIKSSYDIYPRNVMWDERVKGIKLIDFGDWERISSSPGS